MKNNLKFVQSILFAAMLVCVFVPAITIAAELNAPLKAWLAKSFFHHWVGKSILSTVIFIVSAVLMFLWPRKINIENIYRLILLLLLSAAVSVMVILGFFLYEFLA